MTRPGSAIDVLRENDINVEVLLVGGPYDGRRVRVDLDGQPWLSAPFGAQGEVWYRVDYRVDLKRPLLTAHFAGFAQRELVR